MQEAASYEQCLTSDLVVGCSRHPTAEGLGNVPRSNVISRDLFRPALDQLIH